MRKIIICLLTLSMVCVSSFTVQAATNNIQTPLGSNEVMVTSEFSIKDNVRMPTMGLFEQFLYTEGTNVISLINTTKGVQIPDGIHWLPAGYYVRKAHAGLKQGKDVKRSEYTNNGTKSVSMFNIPWEKDYARNNWVCSRNP